ncbi:MAG: hypothetical protein ACHP8B_06685 [Terriglobales bacterium]
MTKRITPVVLNSLLRQTGDQTGSESTDCLLHHIDADLLKKLFRRFPADQGKDEIVMESVLSYGIGDDNFLRSDALDYRFGPELPL